MTKPIIVVLGAGNIGSAITHLLVSSGRFAVRLTDIDEKKALLASRGAADVSVSKLNLEDRAHSRKLLEGAAAAVSALPFHCDVQAATLALECKVPFLNLTEDVQTTKAITNLAEKTGITVIPQCGLAPGFISIAAAHLMAQFESVESVKMRVGALPVFPNNMLKYNRTWSTEGLINEYGNPCEAIIDGKHTWVLPLEGYERFSLDGVEYEAFNTSGGLGSMCESYAGKTQQLSYKTIRYPGHRELVYFLMRELGFNEDRALLKELFERHVPATFQDKVIVFVEVLGRSHGTLVARTYASTIYGKVLGGIPINAIQLTTAVGVLAPLDLLLSGSLPRRLGIIKSEEIPLKDFLNNEFGRHYHDEKALAGIAV